VAFLAVLMIIAVLVMLLWAGARFVLAGEDLSRFDAPPAPDAPPPTRPSAEHDEAVATIRRMQAAQQGRMSRRERTLRMRQAMDAMAEGIDFGVDIVPASAGGVPAEWVLAPGADPDRRLLYIHGGGFVMGSPKSHRAITSTLSKIAGACVLAIDYRLMPENGRLDGLEDCRTTYGWILENGPRGAGPAESLFVAGDSAGGNLTLVLVAWARDAGLRAADGVVALSPMTDATFSSPSMRTNLESDQMLGPALAGFVRLPRFVTLWVALLMSRVPPADPRLSPVRGDLSNLPPILVHASEAEVLVDDARRYVAKARAAGSPVELATWPHTLHVWHIFDQTPEARAAFEHIEAFLERRAPRTADTRTAGEAG